MDTDESEVIVNCKASEGCSGRFRYRSIRHVGGVNDKGGWVVRCTVCSGVQAFAVIGDVNDSSLLSGATPLDAWDVELENREAVLARHGLSV